MKNLLQNYSIKTYINKQSDPLGYLHDAQGKDCYLLEYKTGDIENPIQSGLYNTMTQVLNALRDDILLLNEDQK